MIISDKVQLRQALVVFGRALFGEAEGTCWTNRVVPGLMEEAGITSMCALRQGCNDGLEVLGNESVITHETLSRLNSFLPGPVGWRCFRLAQACAEKVKDGSADVKYVHRPESGTLGKENWDVSVMDEEWTMHVDCAGFIRNVLKHVTNDPWRLSLSDRDFMRAKDFFVFFQSIPYTVMDGQELQETKQRMKWRRIDDLRMVIPGDVIVYRPKGRAAGDAAFTTTDRSDIDHMLKAVKTSIIWQEEAGEWHNLVTRNVAKDPHVKEWVKKAKRALAKIGIKTVKAFRANVTDVRNQLSETYPELFSELCLDLMVECATTTALNTGHIVFASGPAVYKGDNEYRIQVIHSTKSGVKDENGNPTEGVQEYFRRFTMIQHPNGNVTWTREVRRVQPPEDLGAPEDAGDKEDNPYDDMEEDNNGQPDDSSDDDEEKENGSGDELEGQTNVEVIAARMCF